MKDVGFDLITCIGPDEDLSLVEEIVMVTGRAGSVGLCQSVRQPAGQCRVIRTMSMMEFGGGMSTRLTGMLGIYGLSLPPYAMEAYAASSPPVTGCQDERTSSRIDIEQTLTPNSARKQLATSMQSQDVSC